MQFAQSAASRLQVRLEPRPRGEQAWAWLVALLVGSDNAKKDLVITRIESGEVLVRAPIRKSFEWTADQMTRELKKYDESDWLAKWGNPSAWTSV